MAIAIVSWVAFLIWIAIEYYTAPTVNQQGKTVIPGRKLKDLFKKKK
jgi:hypothetical protein